MRILYHWTLDPASRQARIVLSEAKLKFNLETVDPWNPSAEYAALCPESVPPTLVDQIAGGSATISSARAICEYVNDITPRLTLLPADPVACAEIRRLCHWFDDKFSGEVNAYILYERLAKSRAGAGAPDAATLRAGREHLEFHLNYIEWLLERRDWIGGARFSLADIAAGAHISCLDFLAEIRWRQRPHLKAWYQKFKSRPSVQKLLSDRIAGLIPPRYYADLDF